jgi:hypothetical protein
MEGIMKISHRQIWRWSLAALACMALGACKDQREPVKPITGAQPALATVALS